MLVNGFDATVTTDAGSFAISAQRYGGEVVSPEGHKLLVDFDRDGFLYATSRAEGTVYKTIRESGDLSDDVAETLNGEIEKLKTRFSPSDGAS